MPCLERMSTFVRARLVQCRARAHYRLNRWKASRVRHKWIERENEYRKELQTMLQSSSLAALDKRSPGSSTTSPDGFPIHQLAEQSLKMAQSPLQGPIWVASMTEEFGPSKPALLMVTTPKVETLIDFEEGVSVLSPQRLSERLSENALAREAVGESDLELAQYLKDERIALFLQNDEFITELRSNQEFMSSLQREHEGDSEVEDDYDYDEGQNYRGRRLNSRRGEGGGNVIPPLDDATFKARIATMGKASRKKFAQIAKVFSRGKRSTGSRSLLPSVGGGTTSANGKDFLMSSDPLIDDFEEDRIQSSSDSILSSSPRMNP